MILRNLCNGTGVAGPRDPARRAPYIGFTRHRHAPDEEVPMQEAVRKEKPAAAGSHAGDLRTALDWLRSQGDLIETDKPVDPDLEVTGLQKHMDGGCPVLFNNVKGKPHHRVLTNLFGDIKEIGRA